MPETVRTHLRLPEALVEVLKAKVRARGEPCQSLVRAAVEKAI